ncbi:MAG TPA: PIN domain-containing protein [Rhizomicrobium sp.]|nr:PIN domain-containing protein [Rhizomicrobium sp.]
MSADIFFDSNIFLYVSSADREKSELADRLVRNGGNVSTQVLNEFANVARLKFGLSYAEIRRKLYDIRQICTVHSLDLETHELGLNIAERYQFKLYGSMIVASALRAGCRTLYTEDLQHGQTIDGLALRNPFKA